MNRPRRIRPTEKHSVCEECLEKYALKAYKRTKRKVRQCCFCKTWHTGGLLVYRNPRFTPCGGKHVV